MFEFCYDYVKPKYGEEAKLCSMDTNITYIKIDDTKFDASNYELDRPLTKRKKQLD